MNLFLSIPASQVIDVFTLSNSPVGWQIAAFT
jgi:hypothetical protein